MTEVRAGVDAIDTALVTLLAQRFGYMDAAARIKPDRASVRDEARKAQVLAHVCDLAQRLNVPRARIEAIWEELIEQSIAHEFAVWDEMRR